MTAKHEEFWDAVFKKEFAKESDRACVILSVAMLDQALESLLKACLVPTSSSEDDLLNGAYAPISTFNARVALAHRLGLISARFCHDLHTIRKTRNDFAHNITGCSFEDSTVRNRIIELTRSSKLPEKFPGVRKTYPEGCRGEFQMTVSCMLWLLWALSREVPSIESRHIEALYWSKDELEKEFEKFSDIDVP